MTTIVFLGPSLLLEEAKKILPQASYLPPVRCGDILRALRLKPSTIAIIDGYFESTAAVWHKEILYAIEQGVTVVGSSSMGALRAAELADYGMMGIGEIFSDFHQKKIIDDDEVAVLHAPKQSNYLTLTEAMVDIRATLSRAVTENIINLQTATFIARIAKQLIYQERTLNKAIELARNDENKETLLILKQWLEAGNTVCQKKQDAITLLQLIADDKIQKKSALNQFKIPRSVFFRALHKNIMCRPFSSFQSWLPMQEKVALASRYLGINYQLSRRLAYLLAVSHALAMKLTIEPTLEQQRSIFNNEVFGLDGKICYEIWHQEYDCVVEEKMQFAKRIARIQLLLQSEQQMIDAHETTQDYLLAFMRLLNDYQKYKTLAQANLNSKISLSSQICCLYQAQEPVKFQIIKYTAILWRLIEIQAIRSNLQPARQQLQEYSDKFRYKQGILTQKATEEWLQNNDLDLNGYQNLMISATRFSFLILQNNLDSLNIAPEHNDEEVWWFRDVLWFTGLYQDAKQLLFNTEKIKILQQEQAGIQSDLEQYAYSLDFVEGELDFMNEQVSQL